MNSSSSSTSAQGGTSARMRSMAWVVLSLARVSRRKAVCSASIDWRCEAAALQADAVGAEHADLALADRGGVRQHVLNHDAVGADEGVPADAAELVDADEGADLGPIADGDVAGERDAVGQDDVIADADVVRDVRVGHEQVVAADGGEQAAALRAAVDGDEFADAVAVADAGLGALALVFQVLRGDADGAE